VVNSSLNHRWESLESLLARVETVPSVIHHTVDSVEVSGLWCLDDDWLDLSVFLVWVE
jgi:hypothetical protein